jgi:acylphosphatase
MKRRVKMVVSGRVQGVFFRASTVDQATRLGLVGRVRNLRNGDVEIVAEGEDGRLKALLDWARTGPPRAHVEQVQASYLDPTGEFRDFKVGS